MIFGVSSGPARPLIRAGGNPARVTVSRGPGIEPSSPGGNARIDAGSSGSESQFVRTGNAALIDYQEMIVGGVLTALREAWWLFALVVAIAVARTPVVKGWIGEGLVRLSARMLLKPAVYRPFHNVTLLDERGTTRIDPIFVSPYGVFVVETKNMKGWIFGAAREATWTQKIYRSSHKFQTPLRQNYRDTVAIRKLLDLDEGVIHSIVVFAGGSTHQGQVSQSNTCPSM